MGMLGSGDHLGTVQSSGPVSNMRHIVGGQHAEDLGSAPSRLTW